jgi:hypothetical protein
MTSFIIVKVKKSTAIIGITAAIVVIFMIAIMIFYNPTADYEPLVGLDNGIMVEPGIWKVKVHSSSSGEPLTGFEITLTMNGSIVEIPATPLNTLDSTCNGSPGISFLDAQNDSRLNTGDWFVVCGIDDVSEYQVQIYWISSGNRVSGDHGYIAR